MLMPFGGGFNTGVMALAYVGSSYHHNDDTGSAEALYHLSLPVGSADGDTAVLVRTASGTADFDTTTGFTDIGGDDVSRVSVTVGENNRTAVKTKTLDATDISNGYIEISPNVPANRDVALIVFRNFTSFVWSEATNTESSLADNTIAVRQETAASRAYALMCTWRGGGTRTTTISNGATLIVDSQHTSSGGAGAYALSVFLYDVAAAGLSPSGTVSVSGTANMTLKTFTVLVQ